MRNLSIRCGAGKTLGQELPLPQRSSASMSFGWLFLGGMLSSRATSASQTGGSVQYTQFAGRRIYSERQTIS